MTYIPAKGRFEYHSPSGRHLGAWGNGAFAGFRGLLESEYQNVLTFQQKVQEQVAQTTDPDEDPGWSKPVIGPIAQAMFEASRPIVVQANQDTLINTLFNDARAAHGDEQGAYLVYSFRLGTLSLIRATNQAPQAQRRTRFHWDLGRDPAGRAVMPNDATRVVIGTIHTHWDDRGREAPELSRDVDVPSARTARIVVYALDRRYLHRADPDGTPHNKMTRDISDVLSPAFRAYGKSFVP